MTGVPLTKAESWRREVGDSLTPVPAFTLRRLKRECESMLLSPEIDQKPYLHLLVRLSHRLGHYEDGLRYSEALHASERSHLSLAWVSVELVALGRVTEALAICETLLRIPPPVDPLVRIVALNVTAECLAKTGDQRGAWEAWDVAVRTAFAEFGSRAPNFVTDELLLLLATTGGEISRHVDAARLFIVAARRRFGLRLDDPTRLLSSLTPEVRDLLERPPMQALLRSLATVEACGADVAALWSDAAPYQPADGGEPQAAGALNVFDDGRLLRSAANASPWSEE